MDVITLYHRSLASWTTRLDSLTPAQLGRPTPCEGWTVQDLVNHVVGEELWTRPLMQGQTIEQVGDRFEGDLLGDDPVGAARSAAADATAAVEGSLSGRKVHLSYGDEDAEEYVRQLVADHLIHSWDLAAALGDRTYLDPETVTEVATWFADKEELYRSAGAVGPRADGGGEPQSDLLVAFGRRPDWSGTAAALSRFSAVFGSGDVDAIMALMTDDCVFESTSPTPDGRRFVGRAAVREVWETLFTETDDPGFSEEESFVVGDRGV
jgi:uncharacterized protein (TIGR03086 family)